MAKKLTKKLRSDGKVDASALRKGKMSRTQLRQDCAAVRTYLALILGTTDEMAESGIDSVTMDGVTQLDLVVKKLASFSANLQKAFIQQKTDAAVEAAKRKIDEELGYTQCSETTPESDKWLSRNTAGSKSRTVLQFAANSSASLRHIKAVFSTLGLDFIDRKYGSAMELLHVVVCLGTRLGVARRRILDLSQALSYRLSGFRVFTQDPLPAKDLDSSPPKAIIGSANHQPHKPVLGELLPHCSILNYFVFSPEGKVPPGVSVGTGRLCLRAVPIEEACDSGADASCSKKR